MTEAMTEVPRSSTGVSFLLGKLAREFSVEIRWWHVSESELVLGILHDKATVGIQRNFIQPVRLRELGEANDSRGVRPV